ncbi:MAG: multidrug efflux SMR transporter [Neisseria sp.]|nr:multidrug efflux SMR transporter [Neisseria sp.]
MGFLSFWEQIMSWIYLIAAGLLEIGWPLGLKLAQQEGWRWQGTLLAVLFMAASGFCLFMAQKTIPMGTAYAVWTGIGAAGAFLVGIVFFKDAATFGRWLGALLIISGVVVMKLSSSQ